MTLTVIVEPASTNWCAYTPDDIGFVGATGATRDEAVESFKSALMAHLRAMWEDGRDLPDITELNVLETVPFDFQNSAMPVAA
jgi:predicted RNase H-like HicB family nuclease